MHSYIMQHVERASVDHFSTQHLLLRHSLVQIASGSFMLQILFVYMVMNNLVCIKHFCYIHLYNYAYTSESLTLVT